MNPAIDSRVVEEQLLLCLTNLYSAIFILVWHNLLEMGVPKFGFGCCVYGIAPVKRG